MKETNATSYRGFIIKPKRDFGSHGHLVDGKVVKKGWVVCYGPGTRRDLRGAPNFDVSGCNAMPGATWFQTVNEARNAIKVLIKVKEDPDKFWEIMQPFEYKRVGQKASFKNGEVRQGRFKAIISNFRVTKLFKHCAPTI